jgi:hypothetical protein
MTVPTGWDIVHIDDGVREGFSLVNPEGEIFHETWTGKDISPGWNVLLQEAEELIEAAYARRSILNNEASWFDRNR